MDIAIKRRYLLLPVSFSAGEKRVLFYRNGTLVFDLTVHLEPDASDAVMYPIDMGRFLCDSLTVRTEPETSLEFQQSDTADCRPVREQLRPAAHFTVTRGWINDPNGLVLFKGTYHMFFQYNPAGRDWGNMHWGHAVSTDLFHWKELDAALFPDESGMMFSGSGIVDATNAAGLKDSNTDALLFYYTAAGDTARLSAGKPFTQCMAYSTDGGSTFRKYAGNPLIPHIEEQNRDPKVVWNEELHAYFLALYLREDRYALFTSSDLLHWNKKQELTLPGDSECPDLYPLFAENEEGVQEKYWVFSGAGDRYLVGRFREDGIFRPLQPVGRLHYGTDSYAAQTFSGIPNGRILRMSWNKSDLPGAPFNGSMCTPAEMSLKRIQGKLMLCAMPAREMESISTGSEDGKAIGNRTVKAGEPLSVGLPGKAQDIRVSVSCENGAPFRLSFLGMTVTADPREGILKCKECTMPVFPRDGRIDLRIITDTHAAEIYADQGEAFLCCSHLADYGQNNLILDALRLPVEVAGLSINELKQ